MPHNVKSCHSILCDQCGEKAILDKAWDLSQSIWARVQYISRNTGRDAHVYEVVFSPPQATKAQLFAAVTQAQYEEGLNEWKMAICHAIRQATRRTGAKMVGWTIFYHHARKNGRSGRVNRDWDGNDGEYGHFRLAPHFHVIIVSPLTAGELIEGFNEVRDSCLNDWFIGVGYNKKKKD